MFLLAIAGGAVSGLSVPAGILYLWRKLHFARQNSFKEYTLLRKVCYVTIQIIKAIGIVVVLMSVGELPIIIVSAFSRSPPEPRYEEASLKYVEAWGITVAIVINLVFWGALIFLLGRWLLRRWSFRSDVGRSGGR
jgi:hypothetical protein